MSKDSESPIPLGICCNCTEKQETIASGGFWINGLKEKWACETCKYFIRSYPLACEWCTSADVQWSQGHTYHCRRCAKLGIGQAAAQAARQNKSKQKRQKVFVGVFSFLLFFFFCVYKISNCFIH